MRTARGKIQIGQENKSHPQKHQAGHRHALAQKGETMTLFEIVLRVAIYAFCVYAIYSTFMLAFALYDVWKRDRDEMRDESD